MNADFFSRLESAVMARRGKARGKEIVFACPAHDDQHVGECSYNTEKHAWNCLKCGAKGGYLDLAKRLDVDLSQDDVQPRRRVLRTTRYEFVYHNLVSAIHVRQDYSNGDKAMWWERPDGTKGLGNGKVENLPLYGIDELEGLPDDSVVVVTEGEKSRDALKARGIVAVGTGTGAGTIPVDDRLRPLRRFQILLWPDHDLAGERHMVRIAERLVLMGHGCRIVRWQDAPDKGDAADFAGEDADLRKLLNEAQPWKAGELASPLPQGAIGEWLDEAMRFIRRYVVMTENELRAIALWVAHTHVFASFDSTPYLLITSPEKRSGKTRLLEVLSCLVARPWLTGRVTGALLARKLDRDCPTLLLDENDAAFKGPREYVEVLRQILNVGHRKPGLVSLLAAAGRNDWDEIDLMTFAPKALAGVGSLPDTVLDRGIIIRLQRRSPNEQVERFRQRKVEPIARPIRNAFERWAPLAAESFADARPELPDALDDRAQDGWESLLAIADAAGGEWPVKARTTAVALSTGDAREDESFGARLLADLRTVFADKGVTALRSTELTTALLAMEESPWGDLRGRPLDGRGLARRLRPYNIRPHTVRLGADTAKGYAAEDFSEVWSRYLEKSVTSVTSVTNPVSESENVTDKPQSVTVTLPLSVTNPEPKSNLAKANVPM